jgi:sugar lactone lactonase YvrE
MWENAGYYAVIKYGAGDVGSFNVGGSQVTFYTMPDWGEYPDGSTSVWYRFYGSVEPAKFAFQEDGVATQDFELVSLTAPSAGTFKIPQCALGTIYNSGDVCFVQVALNPQAAGSVSAQLLMQTASTTTGSDGKSVTTYTTVGSTTLHGTGVGPNVNVIPALESTSGSGLKTPSETATDAQGNVYVADAGLGEVVEFAAGSGTPVAVGAGFTAPTGVAVDGNGDVFVADSGNIFEIPYLSTAAPAQLASGLGSNLSLAADGLGNLYVADPSNARVVKLWNLGATQSGLLGQTEAFLTSGFTTPSAVAVDSSNNLYVVDGANLIEVSPSGTSTLLTSLSNAKGLAVDASGAVYIASTGGTSRIPSASGTLNPSSATVIASTVTNPAGVAIDRLGNVYLSDATALNIHKVQTTGTLDFGTLTAATATNTLSATVMNTGNSSLTVTGYSATSAPGGSTSYYPLEYDYYPTDVSCETAAIAAGGNCAFDVEFNPASGDQGTLTSVISIADNATNGTVGLDTTGVAASLAGSTVSFTVGSGSEVINTTVSVTVKATSGTVVPTGEVTVSYPSPTTTLDKSNNPTNQTLTQTVTLTNGAASFTLAPVAAGTTSFTVSYQGDRVFGKASLTATGTIAKSSVIGMVLPAAKTIPMYILENASANGNNSYPYDGKEGAWVYSMPVQVTAKAGTPTGILEFLDSGSVACPTNSGAGTPYLDTTGSVSFNMGCLPMATNLTYTPVISTHVITLSYAGDSNYNGYKYPSSFTFIAVRSPAVLVTKVDTTATTMATTISATDGSSTIATPVTVTAGSSTSVTLTLTSVLGYGIAGSNQQLNNYTFPLSLTCDNLPPHATCTFTYPTPDANLSTAFDISGCDLNGTAPDLPNPYQITGRGCQPGQVVVTINTNVATGTSTTSRNNHSSPFKTGAMLAAGLMGLFFSRKMRRGWRAMMTGLVCLFFLGAALLGSTACSTKNLTPISTLTTPAGTYNVKIVAQQVGTLVVTGSGASTTITGSQNPDSIPFTLPVTVQ